jgi:hypothetical protein
MENDDPLLPENIIKQRDQQEIQDAMDSYYAPERHRKILELRENTKKYVTQYFVQGLPY